MLLKILKALVDELISLVGFSGLIISIIKLMTFGEIVIWWHFCVSVFIHSSLNLLCCIDLMYVVGLFLVRAMI